MEYYQKKAVDLIGPWPVDQTAGLPVATVSRNVASMTARGVDVELSTINTGGALRWTTDLNASYYHDRVLDYYLESERGSSFIGWGNGFAAVEGRPVHAFYSYRWAGLDGATGDPQGYYGGQVSKNWSAMTGPTTLIGDLVYHGPKFPTVFGSLGNTLSWRGFSLTARVLYKMGHYFRANSINYNNLFSRWVGHSDYEKRWQKAGDEQATHVPSMVYPAVSSRDGFYNGSEVLVHRGDNVRLQYVTLSWALVSEEGRRRIFRQLRLSATAQNLGILWRANTAGIDPDISLSDLPAPRTLSLGVHASF